MRGAALGRHLDVAVVGPPAVEIGPARPEDAPSILAVQLAAYRPVGDQYDEPGLPPLTETLDGVVDALRTEVVLVARAAGAPGVDAAGVGGADGIVGSVRGRVGADGTARIARLSVLPALQGRGVGRRLLAAVERRLAPVAAYELFTGDRSERSLRMYERAGYRRVGSTDQTDRVRIVFLRKAGSPGPGGSP